MKRVILLITLLLHSAMGDLFSFLPKSTSSQSGNLTISSDTHYDQKEWASWFSVDSVHHVTLIHKDSDSIRNWSIGIGKGSQIFSLKGAFGECIPPQHHPGAPWIDEVIQMVAVNRTENNREKIRTIEVLYEDTLGDSHIGLTGCKDSAYFIHQAGVYQRDTAIQKEYFFSPILVQKSDHNSFGTICWPQQAHVHNIHRSQALYWQQIKDLDNGVIEVTYGVYNYGLTPLDYFNMPWGGVRRTSLPIHKLSQPDGSAEVKDGAFGDGLHEKLSNTGGWALFTSADTPQAPALTYVFGKDKHLGKRRYESQWDSSYWRYGYAGTMTAYKGIGPRDFFVGVVNPRVTVKSGEFFYWRWYLVAGPQNEVVHQSQQLSDSVEYGYLTFKASEATLLNVYASDNSLNHENNGQLVGTLYDRPVNATFPVFLMRNKSDSTYQITNDANSLNDSLLLHIGMVYRPYLSEYNCESFLGFATSDQYNRLKNSITIVHKDQHEKRQCPSISVRNRCITLNNLERVKALKIFNLRGQELKCLKDIKASKVSLNYSEAANFLVVKAFYNDQTTRIIPLILK